MRRLSLAILATFLLTFTMGAAFAQDEPYDQSQTMQAESADAQPADTTQTGTADPNADLGALPQTASDLPLIAGLGLLALAGAIVVRSGLRRSA